jgi:hypothetical protein
MTELSLCTLHGAYMRANQAAVEAREQFARKQPKASLDEFETKWRRKRR